MKLTIEEIDIIENATLNHITALRKVKELLLENKVVDDLLNETIVLHSKICKLQNEIEDKIKYMEDHPECNQALNELIVIQR